MIDTLRRWKNWIRIKWLETFTSRITRVSVKDNAGKEHEVTVERELEKVCDHKCIREIAPTMWKCDGCDDVYFQISYKVMLTQKDLIGFLEKIAAHLKVQFAEPEDTEHADV